MSLKEVTSLPLSKLAPRIADSHKGDYGRVLIIGGSCNMAGAVSLAGMSALRSGAGLVTLAVPRSIQSTVAGFEPSLMTLALGSFEQDALQQEAADEIFRFSKPTTAVAIGPGMGDHPSTARLVHALYHRLPQPVVLDADGLNAAAEHSEILSSPGGPRILTPHPGEFQRLTGQRCADSPEQRAEQAAELCQRDHSGGTVVVLKGYQTVITDGQQYAVNATGNPGMATGGSGDCLTGIIVALAAQGLSPWDAARLGVHVHGLAGDLAAEKLGQISIIASDLVDFLPEAFGDQL